MNIFYIKIQFNLSFLFFIFISTGLLTLPASAQAGKVGTITTQQLGTKKLIIKNFKKISGKPRFDFLNRALVEILTYALLPLDLRVIPRNDLWSVLRDDIKVPLEEFTTQRIFQKDIYEKLGANYILTGFFKTHEGKLHITGYVDRNNRFGPQRLKLPEFIVEENELLSNAERFANEWGSAILNDSLNQIAIPYLVVDCFKRENDSFSDVDNWVAKNLATIIQEKLAERLKFKLFVTHENNSDKCPSPSERDQLLKKFNIDPDVIIKGTFDIQADSVFIRPAIEFLKHKDLGEFYLPAIKNEGIAYISQRSQTTTLINNLFVSLLTKEGEWNLETIKILIQSKQGNGALEAGRVALGQKNLLLAEILLNKAIEFADEKSFEGSRKLLLARANHLLGKVKLGQSEFNEGIDYFKKALSLNSEHQQALEDLGKLYYKKKDFVRSVFYFEKALKALPGFSLVVEKLGLAYFYLEEFAKAEEQLVIVVKNQSKPSVEVLRALGTVLLERDENKEAAQYFRDAIKIDPEDGESRLLLLNVLAGQAASEFYAEKYPAAIKIYDEALAIEVLTVQELAYFYNIRGTAKFLQAVKESRGFEKALDDFNRAKEHYKKNQQLDKNYFIAHLNQFEVLLVSDKKSNHKKLKSLTKDFLNELKQNPHPQDIPLEAFTRFFRLTILDPAKDKVEFFEDLEQLKILLNKENYNSRGSQFEILEDYLKKTKSISEKNKPLLFQLLNQLDSLG